jgi:uncharacterized membrane protein YfcA
MAISKAGVGMYATMVVALLHIIGVDVDEGVVTEVLLALATIATFSVWAYGQFARKDLKYGIIREE